MKESKRSSLMYMYKSYKTNHMVKVNHKIKDEYTNKK